MASIPLRGWLLLVVTFAPFACTPQASPQSQPPAAPFWALAGTYGSSLATPITFLQNGSRATAAFDRNGLLDCSWHPSGVYLCSWRSDTGSGLARIWWQGDRPAGQYGVGQSADNGGRIDFWQAPAGPPAAAGTASPGLFGLPIPTGLPIPGLGTPPAATPAPTAAGTAPPAATATSGGSSGCSGSLTPPPATALGASCSYNSTCPDEMRCLNGKCAISLGTKCGASSDCSRIGNKYDCKSSGPWKMDGVCTAR